MNYLSRFSLSALLAGALILVVIFNPYASIDMAAFLAVAFVILHKIFDEHLILLLIGARPLLDHWRDYNIFSTERLAINLNAAISVLLLMWAIYFFIANRFYFKKIPALIPWLLFIIWNAATFIYSYDHYATVTETVKAANLFSLFGIACVLYLKQGQKFEKKILLTLAISAVAPLLFALYQLLIGTGMSIDGVPNRVYGTFAHPNILATFTLLLLMIVFYKLFNVCQKRNYKPQAPMTNAQSNPNAQIINGFGNWNLEFDWSLGFGHWDLKPTVRNKYKLAACCLIALPLLILVATYTRVAWIGAALFFTVIGWRYFRKFLLIALASIAGFYLLFYPFNHFLTDNFNYNLQSIGIVSRLTSRNEEADSIKWRSDVINKVIPMYLKRPILGYGYGAFPKVWNDNKGLANLWDTTSEAHNDYLKVGFEAGAVGLVLFISIFAALLWRELRYARKKQWKNLVFIASILVYLVLSLSDNMLHHTPVIWWMWAVWGLWSAKFDDAGKTVI